MEREATAESEHILHPFNCEGGGLTHRTQRGQIALTLALGKAELLMYHSSFALQMGPRNI